MSRSCRRTASSGCWPSSAPGSTGAVTVGVYPTSPANEVAYVLGHSEAEIVVCEDQEQVDKVLAAAARTADAAPHHRDRDEGRALLSRPISSTTFAAPGSDRARARAARSQALIDERARRPDARRHRADHLHVRLDRQAEGRDAELRQLCAPRRSRLRAHRARRRHACICPICRSAMWPSRCLTHDGAALSSARRSISAKPSAPCRRTCARSRRTCSSACRASGKSCTRRSTSSCRKPAACAWRYSSAALRPARPSPSGRRGARCQKSSSSRSGIVLVFRAAAEFHRPAPCRSRDDRGGADPGQDRALLPHHRRAAGRGLWRDRDVGHGHAASALERSRAALRRAGGARASS